MRILVVGAGIFGLSAAFWCRRKGMDVAIVDAGPVPNPASSSYDHHRLIRYPYGHLSGYARMIPAAFRAWNAVFEVLDKQLYHQTGTLAIGDRDTGWIGASLPPMDDQGIEYEKLSSEDVERRFPFLRLKTSTAGLYTPTGGVLLASDILERLTQALRRQNVEVTENLELVGTDLMSEATVVGRADVIVVATGAYGRLLPEERSGGLRSTRQICAYPDDPPEWLHAESGCPMILDLDEKNGLYLVPSVAGTPSKFGDHLPGSTRRAAPDPRQSIVHSAHDQLVDGATRGEKERLRKLYEGRVREALPESCTYRVCQYAMTDDRRFIFRDTESVIGMHGIPDMPSEPRILEIGGGSGHGFKFGPLIGLIVSDLLDGRLDTDEARSIITGLGGSGYLR